MKVNVVLRLVLIDVKVNLLLIVPRGFVLKVY